MTNLEKYELRQRWYKATGELPYGVQLVFKDILGLVAEGKNTSLVFNADYRGSGACLVNAGANMLVSGGGHGIPMQHFHEVVSTFDAINSMLGTEKVNTDGFVSPLAADILLQWFGPQKPQPTSEDSLTPTTEGPYIEISDEEMADAFKEILTSPQINPSPFNVPSLEVQGFELMHEVPD